MPPKKKSSAATSGTKRSLVNIPEKFRTVLLEFIKELEQVFPEFNAQWSQWNTSEKLATHIRMLFDHMTLTLPPHFFSILYQDEEPLVQDFMLFPQVPFRDLYNAPQVSETTHTALWKYMQLILFTLMETLKNANHFGAETQSMFETVDEAALQEKLMETFSNMTDFFTQQMSKGDDEDGGGKGGEQQDEEEETNQKQGQPSSPPQQSTNEASPSSSSSASSSPFAKLFEQGNLPGAEGIHEHLKRLFEGKLGRLAQEMAEEFYSDFVDIMKDANPDTTNSQDFLKQMMKNPTKWMGIVKKMSSKLNERMQKGDISQEEIMKEAGDFFRQMKTNPDFAEMMKKATKSMGKNAKIDTNALARMEKQFQQKERIQKKVEEKKKLKAAAAAAAAAASSTAPPLPPGGVLLSDPEQPNHKIFRVPGTTKAVSQDDIDSLLQYIEGPSSKKSTKTV